MAGEVDYAKGAGGSLFLTGEGGLGPGAEVHRLEHGSPVEGGVDRAWTFDDEGAFGVPDARVTQELTQPFDGRVARTEVFRQLRQRRARHARP